MTTNVSATNLHSLDQASELSSNPAELLVAAKHKVLVNLKFQLSTTNLWLFHLVEILPQLD